MKTYDIFLKHTRDKLCHKRRQYKVIKKFTGTTKIVHYNRNQSNQSSTVLNKRGVGHVFKNLKLRHYKQLTYVWTLILTICMRSKYAKAVLVERR